MESVWNSLQCTDGTWPTSNPYKSMAMRKRKTVLQSFFKKKSKEILKTPLTLITASLRNFARNFTSFLRSINVIGTRPGCFVCNLWRKYRILASKKRKNYLSWSLVLKESFRCSISFPSTKWNLEPLNYSTRHCRWPSIARSLWPKPDIYLFILFD